MPRAPIAGAMPRARPRASRRSSERLRTGVNVSGYLDTESGMGEAARASIRSLEAAGMPVALNNVAVEACGRATCPMLERIRRGQPAPFQPRAPQRRQHGLVRRGPRPRVLPQSLHHRLLVLGIGGVPRRVGALLRPGRRGLGGKRLRSRVVRRLVPRPRRAHATAGRPASQCPCSAGRISGCRPRQRLSLHVRCLEPDGAEKPEGRHRRLPPRAASTTTKRYSS